MRISKFAASVTAAAAFAAPAAALAAAGVSPADGTFTGAPSYKVHGKKQTAKLTLTVAGRKITGVSILAQMLPVDAKHSHGYACSSANSDTTKGDKVTGSTTADGHFAYTFTATWGDKVKVVGRFTDARHAIGTYHDVYTVKVASSHCDSGAVHFSVAKS